MPLTKTLFPLFVMGGLGVTAVLASCFLPVGSATRVAAAEISAEGLDPHTSHRPHLSLLQERKCLPEGGPLGNLRAAARSALVDGDLLSRTWATDQAIRATSALGLRSTPGDLDAATSYAALYLDLDETAGLPIRNEARWSRHTLSQGEHLAGLWSDAWGLRLRTLYRLLEEPKAADLLNRVYPGQEVEWQIDADGTLKRLRLWNGDRAEGNEWLRVAGGDEYELHRIQGAREITYQVLTGQVRDTISASLEVNEALPASTADALALLLIRHLPLPDDVRDGDQYALLVETETLAWDDTPYDVRLLAFDYSGQAITVRAVRHSNGRFYTPEGRSLLPPFDRLPFTGNYRISSGYNPGRRHPVTGRVAPHRGTDFPMAVGTPIVAPADGKVTQVDSHPTAGRHVVIEHGQGYTTRYLHLQRALVRPGQTVARGQRIAHSGNSGRTTSPHLHYELHIDGRAVDAMRAELPDNEVLAGAELGRFQRVAQPLLAELRDATTSRQIAMAPFPAGPDF